MLCVAQNSQIWGCVAEYVSCIGVLSGFTKSAEHPSKEGLGSIAESCLKELAGLCSSSASNFLMEQVPRGHGEPWSELNMNIYTHVSIFLEEFMCIYVYRYVHSDNEGARKKQRSKGRERQRETERLRDKERERESLLAQQWKPYTALA